MPEPLFYSERDLMELLIEVAQLSMTVSVLEKQLQEKSLLLAEIYKAKGKLEPLMKRQYQP